MRTRIAMIGAGVGLTALVWLVWAAITHRPADRPPSGAAATPPDGPTAEDKHGPRTVASGRDPNAAGPETTIQIRRYPEDGQAGNRGDAIRVQLDTDRLRAHGLSRDDVMISLTESTILDSTGRAEPPPGVVFVKHLFRPDQYEKVVVKASAEGEIVRLKDVARVEPLAGREAQKAAPDRGRNAGPGK